MSVLRLRDAICDPATDAAKLSKNSRSQVEPRVQVCAICSSSAIAARASRWMEDTCFPHSRQTPIPTRSARGDRDCNCSNHDCQQRSRKLRAKRHRTAPDRTDRRRLPSVWQEPAGRQDRLRATTRHRAATCSPRHLARGYPRSGTAAGARGRHGMSTIPLPDPLVGLVHPPEPIGFGSGAPRDIPLGRAVRRSRSPGTSRMRLLAFTAAPPSVPHDATGQGCDELGA
jgi:hypothetical protein